MTTPNPTTRQPIVRGLAARELDDFITPHFTVREVTRGRGWWPHDVEGEIARYHHMLTVLGEPVRALLGVPLQVLSGARPAEHNDGGRASSMHLPPVQRAAPSLRFSADAAERRGAALDVVPQSMRCDMAFRMIDAAMRAGQLPKGGLFWYASNESHPGPEGGRFIHFDFRPTGLAREMALTPPKGRAP